MSALPLRPESFSHASGRWMPTRPRPEERPELDALRVVTLNAWFEPFAAARRAAGLIALIEAGEADVVCLQEVTPMLAEALRASPGIRDEMEMVRSASSYDAYGLVVLSRLPLAAAWERELPSMMNRSLLAVEINASHEKLTVATVHLESTRLMATTRVAQLEEVFGVLLGDCVLVGDFNFDPADPEETALDPRFTDVWPWIRPREPGYTEDTTENLMRLRHHGGREKHVRYDRVLAHLPGWRVGDVHLFATEPLAEGVHVSDHFGVCASFERTTRTER